MNEIMKRILLLVVDLMKIRVLLEENEDLSATTVQDIISLEEMRDTLEKGGIAFEKSCWLAPEAHNAIIGACSALSFMNQVYDAVKREENGYLDRISEIVKPEDFASYFESTGLDKAEAEAFGKRAAVALEEYNRIEEFKKELAAAYRKRGERE